MDKLKYMKTFMLTVEEGSIAKAATKMSISKAAASKQLIELENKFQTQLLYRTSRILKLTDAGKLFYESLKNVFSAVEQAETIITQTHDKPLGLLRIASHRHFGEKYILANIREFVTLYPNLKLDIELADRFPDLEKENFDILCGIGDGGPDHLIRKKIATVNHILCASPEYLAKFGTPKNLEDLKKHHYITHSFRGKTNVLKFKNNKEIYLDFQIRLNDAQAMLQCALQGLGFIKIYNYFAQEHIQNGRLIEILKDYREPPKALFVFYQQQKFLPNKIRVFIDFLCKKVNSDKKYFI